MRTSSGLTNISRWAADNHTLFANGHNFIVRHNSENPDDSTVTIGNFNINKDGFLVNSRGLPVLSITQQKAELLELNKLQINENRYISVPSKNIVITKDGSVYADNKIISKIEISEFTDIRQIKKAGNNL